MHERIAEYTVTYSQNYLMHSTNKSISLEHDEMYTFAPRSVLIATISFTAIPMFMTANHSGQAQSSRWF